MSNVHYQQFGGSDLAPGGKPPHDGNMEARITKLEEHVGTLRVDVATIEERTKHLATKTWIMTGVIFVLITILGAAWWMIQQYLSPILAHLAK